MLDFKKIKKKCLNKTLLIFLKNFDEKYKMNNRNRKKSRKVKIFH